MSKTTRRWNPKGNRQPRKTWRVFVPGKDKWELYDDRTRSKADADFIQKLLERQGTQACVRSLHSWNGSWPKWHGEPSKTLLQQARDEILEEEDQAAMDELHRQANLRSAGRAVAAAAIWSNI